MGEFAFVHRKQLWYILTGYENWNDIKATNCLLEHFALLVLFCKKIAGCMCMTGEVVFPKAHQLRAVHFF